MLFKKSFSVGTSPIHHHEPHPSSHHKDNPRRIKRCHLAPETMPLPTNLHRCCLAPTSWTVRDSPGFARLQRWHSWAKHARGNLTVWQEFTKEMSGLARGMHMSQCIPRFFKKQSVDRDRHYPTVLVFLLSLLIPCWVLDQAYTISHSLET